MIYGEAGVLPSDDLADQASLLASIGYFGAGDVELGDYDGDGLDDVAVADTYAGMSGMDYPGGVYVVFADGGRIGDLALPGDADAFFSGPTESGTVMAGYQLASGDLDGDGCEELTVGAHSYGNGTAWVFQGGPRWSGDYDYTTAVATIAGGSVWPFAVSIEVMADHDGDGREELFIGASSTGAWVFHGADISGSRTEDDATLALTTTMSTSLLGYRVTTGDLDDDGLPDAVASAAWAYTNYGGVWFFSGTGF